MYIHDYHDEALENLSFCITGGGGFIGSHIAEYLMLKGAGKVRVLDNFSTGSAANVEQFMGDDRFELMEGDICDPAVCRRAVEGMDFVLHQAALGSVPRSIHDPVRTNEVNISGFLNVLVASRDAGVRRMVYAASSSTYGDHPGLPKIEHEIGNPLSPYAVTKYVNELYASVFSRTYNFHTIGLRYFNVFGPRQNPKGPYAAVIPLFVEAALKQQPPSINGDGETSRDFTFVENVVQANMKALFAPLQTHEVLNVACGEMTSLNTLWELISSDIGVNIPANYAPPRVGDIKHSLASVDKAKKLLSYEPLIDMRTGLKETIRWSKEAYAIPAG